MSNKRYISLCISIWIVNNLTVKRLFPANCFIKNVGCVIVNVTSSAYYIRTGTYHLKVSSSSLCQEECQKHKDCHYFTYTTENKKCTLMNSKAIQNIKFKPGSVFVKSNCIFGKHIRKTNYRSFNVVIFLICLRK